VLSHETVWAAIDALAARNGLSPSGLARRAGLDPTSFNLSKRHAGDGRPRWPSTESLAKILNATNETLETFACRAGVSEDSLSGLKVPTSPAGSAGIAAKRALDRTDLLTVSELTEFSFPDLTIGAAFAMRVSGSSFLPLYRDGDILVVSRDAAVTRGDRLVLKPRGENPSLYELHEQAGAELRLCSIGDKPASVSYRLSAIEWSARIIWASQ